MVLCLERIDAGTVARFLKDPSVVEPFLEERSEKWEESMTELLSADLDKAWQGLHYLLTGDAWGGSMPWSFLLSGGMVLENLDLGYGPQQIFNVIESAEIERAIRNLEESTLRERFDRGAMMKAEIYPNIWDGDPAEDDTLGYLMEYFGVLKKFLARVAETSSGMLIYTS